jgi:hypothetical protein
MGMSKRSPTSEANSQPANRKLKMLSEEFVERAVSIYEQRGSIPETELEDWLEAEEEFRSAA